MSNVEQANTNVQSKEGEKHETFLLPAPDLEAGDAVKLDARSNTAIKFDELGPMVVNSDGTLSRIANWQNMTELERERTLRVLNARNQIRLAHQRQVQGVEGKSS
ncbi:hypothetical protein K474DRAFT_1659998 [Panus rudis PR-1116 ss-1]|nr:hypothetical protein K474DRAFT_1659998 [Panus rudis PR-1116 ss-1]